VAPALFARAATGLALVAAPLAAQTGRAPWRPPRFTVAGGLAFADHRVDMGFGVERSTGTVFNLQVGVDPNPRVTVVVSGQTGVLHTGPGATLPRDLAEIGLATAYRARPWLDVEGGVRVRSYTTSVGRQRWTLPSLGAAGRVPFALEGLQGVLGLAVHPFAAVSGLADPEVALSSRVGMQFARGRFTAEALYTLDRFDFERGTTRQRLEQYAALTLRLQIRTAPALRRTPFVNSGS
jgi:hypothetical protein